tara:strand:+ start:1189 stop:1761 length:573 start_codon:yes stop_codon:yes gene_type:complete
MRRETQKMKTILINLVMLMLVTRSGQALAQTPSFVPPEFEVPTVLENNFFRIRTLTVNDVVKDYDAVMSSVEHLQGVFGPNSTWPEADLTFEQDLIDLGWHQKEFQNRSTFAYTVVSLDEKRVLGCIYINPTNKGDFDAEITMWVRADVVENGYDVLLFKTVSDWVSQTWPFQNPGYPGRITNWEQWLAL